jgi:hypothetical protein
MFLYSRGTEQPSQQRQPLHLRQQLEHQQKPKTQHPPIWEDTMPLGRGDIEFNKTGLTNSQVYKNFYFDELGGTNEELRQSNSTRVLRNESLKLLRQMYRDVGGKNEHMINHAPPRILLDEYKRLLEEKIIDARRKYIAKGGRDPNVINSSNLHHIEEEINRLTAIGMFGL